MKPFRRSTTGRWLLGSLLAVWVVGLVDVLLKGALAAAARASIGLWFVLVSSALLVNWRGSRDELLDEQDYWLARSGKEPRVSRRIRAGLIIAGSVLALPPGLALLILGVFGLASALLAVLSYVCSTLP